MSRKILFALLVVALVLGNFAVLMSAAQSPAGQALSPQAKIWSALSGHPSAFPLGRMQLDCAAESGGNCSD